MQEQFNSYMDHIDIDFLRDYCFKYGKLCTYKKNEPFLVEGTPCHYIGFVRTGILKVYCINESEGKEYNLGFAFPNEFIGDYPTCLYEMNTELNAKAITDSEIIVASTEPYLKLIEENMDYQVKARVISDSVFFQVLTRYLEVCKLTPEERYLKLLDRYPDLLKNISLKELSSYLKITPTHMSRIRKSILR